MLLNLRRNIVKNILLHTIASLALLAALVFATGVLAFSVAALIWLLLPCLAGALGWAWYTLRKMQKRIIGGLSAPFSYQHVLRAPDDGVNWRVLDECAAQLASRQYVCVGDFCAYPASNRLAGVASCFIDEAQSTLIEVQFLTTLQESIPGESAHVDGLHFSITSLIAGKIRVTTTDHFAVASHYLIRGDNSVHASYPDCDLPELLDKHERMLRKLQQKLGKKLSRGLNIERYIVLQRENRQQAMLRMSRMGPLQLMQEVEHFEASFPNKWAPPSSELKALPNISLEWLDQSEQAQGQRLIMPANGQGQ